MAGCASCLHKNVHQNVCSACLGGTHFYPRNKTNGDLIRGMTDEELAIYLYVKTCEDGYPQFDTVDGWLDWLRQEATNDGGD